MDFARAAVKLDGVPGGGLDGVQGIRHGTGDPRGGSTGVLGMKASGSFAGPGGEPEHGPAWSTG